MGNGLRYICMALGAILLLAGWAIILEKADNIAKAVDYGLVGGGGLELWLDSLALVLEARYHYGLANINDGGPFDFNTSSILVLVGFKF